MGFLSLWPRDCRCNHAQTLTVRQSTDFLGLKQNYSAFIDPTRNQLSRPFPTSPLARCEHNSAAVQKQTVCIIFWWALSIVLVSFLFSQHKSWKQNKHKKANSLIAELVLLGIFPLFHLSIRFIFVLFVLSFPSFRNESIKRIDSSDEKPQRFQIHTKKRKEDIVWRGMLHLTRHLFDI